MFRKFCEVLSDGQLLVDRPLSLQVIEHMVNVATDQLARWRAGKLAT